MVIEYAYMLVGFMVGAFISASIFLSRDKCEHDWEFQGTTNVFSNNGDKYPNRRYDSYKCKNCFEYKKIDQ